MNQIIFKKDSNFPPLLKEINDPPDKLYVKGNVEKLLDKNMKILCVVGARAYSSYGKEVVEKLISGLRGYNICIVSGLALGIDSIAHRSAMDNGLYTIAFPGSGLDPEVLYPATHLRLAEEITKSGGALLSELEPDTQSAPWTFPKRNRLLAGISHATLVIEAELKSGTLITSKYATEYNRDVGTIPGNIFSPLSAGPHMLIRLGATPITCPDDLLEFLGFARREGQSSLPLEKSELNLQINSRLQNLSENEKKIIHLLQIEPRNKDSISRELGIDAQKTNMYISILEIEGLIKEENGVVKIV